jgi:Flp pilus assembly pilin Flp
MSNRPQTGFSCIITAAKNGGFELIKILYIYSKAVKGAVGVEYALILAVMTAILAALFATFTDAVGDLTTTIHSAPMLEDHSVD